ncbi:unnamed protein product [Phytophthora fragariaefolia]|uniref:Unnamed protein product n=1 Tax=Phytophthora fragariaefolia TaxID=1490495 RepID=A0A9W7D9A5_9STRA|nr:unnamed protein product [Phytophthora fragariaefolia]
MQSANKTVSAGKRPNDATATLTTRTFGHQWLRGRTWSTSAIGYLPLRCAGHAKLGNGLANPTLSAASRDGCDFLLFSLHPQDCFSCMVTRNSAATSGLTMRHLPSVPSELLQATTLSETSIKARVWRDNMAYTPIPFGGQWAFHGLDLPYVDRRTGERVPPKFWQIYIVDPDMQERANRRKVIFADLDIVSLQDIENMMLAYRLEVGVAMVEDGNHTRPRDLYVVAKDHSLLRLFEIDDMYDPLQYPLLFPYGDLGWTMWRIAFSRKLTIKPLYIKADAFSNNGLLTNVTSVNRNSFGGLPRIRKKLRAELYHGISDALLNEVTITLDEGEVLVSEYDRATGTLVHPDRGSGYDHFLNEVGKRIVLPDSHSGSPRNMYKHYQESMAIVRELLKIALTSWHASGS